MLETQTTPDGVTFHVQVQPRASRAGIVGLHQDSLKIKLTAPPVGGAANQQCIELLAKALNRPKSAVTIIRGLTNRRKQVRIGPAAGPMTAIEAKDLVTRLRRLAEPAAAPVKKKPQKTS